MQTTEVVTITHSSEGVKLTWPNSTSNTFANIVYLAESYALSIRAKEKARQQLVKNAGDQLNRLCKLIENDASATELSLEADELRSTLLEVVKFLA